MFKLVNSMYDYFLKKRLTHRHDRFYLCTRERKSYPGLSLLADEAARLERISAHICLYGWIHTREPLPWISARCQKE